VRYGNVAGSRGSVLPYFQSLRSTGELPITDERMTRFWITLEQGVEFVLKSLERMNGGEVYVPKIPSIRITDLARAVAPECKTKVVGIRPGEKLHEVLISEDDARHAVEYDDYYAILPVTRSWTTGDYVAENGGRPCPDGFCYSSDKNTQWLSTEELRAMAEAGSK
jgi:UDP-N-acetylglucosamine 4,6-dehydratase